MLSIWIKTENKPITQHIWFSFVFESTLLVKRQNILISFSLLIHPAFFFFSCFFSPYVLLYKTIFVLFFFSSSGWFSSVLYINLYATKGTHIKYKCNDFFFFARIKLRYSVLAGKYKEAKKWTDDNVKIKLVWYKNSKKCWKHVSQSVGSKFSSYYTEWEQIKWNTLCVFNQYKSIQLYLFVAIRFS